MKYQVGRMSPVPNSDHKVRLKPPVIPFFFLPGLEVHRIHFDPKLL
jgi:hypothetical protein